MNWLKERIATLGRGKHGNLNLGKESKLNDLSEDGFDALKALSNVEVCNVSQEKSLMGNGSRFKRLSEISEDENIETIETGFQLQAKGKIFLKNYYQETEKFTLFQWKGYQIKYESIRRTKLY